MKESKLNEYLTRLNRLKVKVMSPGGNAIEYEIVSILEDLIEDLRRDLNE